MVQSWIEEIKKDVNSDDSKVIHAFGEVTDMIFKVLLFLGIPFMFYVLNQFIQLI
ncbi:hypothetical protein [Mesobacillus harenae]|uniref:hypothetical protein n=1 Tax=Mesobacillus harenae TaxID=2213203 RepID=UPI0015806FEC|nr:hypothetical protein [Mesobacillus harenae]